MPNRDRLEWARECTPKCVRRAIGALAIGGLSWGALAAGALAGATALAILGLRHLPAPPAYHRLPQAANGRVTEIPVRPGEPWAVQILGDVQDGFLYLPELLARGAASGSRAVVFSGDLARGAGGDHLWLLTRQLEAHPSATPIFAVPGNHDIVTAESRANFERCFGPTEFEVHIGDAWLVGLDSSAGPRPESTARVRRVLARAHASGDRVVVIRHHSPLSSGDPAQVSDESAALRSELRDPAVALVISGHAHSWDYEQRDNVRFVIAPPSGDRSHGQGQTVVSSILLRWRDGELTLEHDRAQRSDLVELRTAYEHVVYGHVLPSLARQLALLSPARPTRTAPAAIVVTREAP